MIDFFFCLSLTNLGKNSFAFGLEKLAPGNAPNVG
jgi:hypothetical protein